MAYEVTIDGFEGPLDLLLYLIQKNKIDIYDIPIAQITQQYLSYINKWKELDLDIASEFIVMASRLLEIKSRSLLPRASKDDESEEDMKEALVQQLLDYQVFKKISVYLEEREINELGMVTREEEYIPEYKEKKPIEVHSEDLVRAFRKVIAMYRDDHILKKYSSEIYRDNFTVKDKINLINHDFKSKQKKDINFADLLLEKGQSEEVVVTLQAILEMYKLDQIEIKQNGLFKEIILENKGE